MSLYGLFETLYTFLGPTFPIGVPISIICSGKTIKFGDTWQYEIVYSPLDVTTVYPPAPLKEALITLQVKIEYIIVFSGAGISIPEWVEEAPLVGDCLGPKYEDILL